MNLIKSEIIVIQQVNPEDQHITKCNINDTQKLRGFKPGIFHNLNKYDCHLFSKSLVDKKNNKLKFDIIPETNEEYTSVTYECI